MSNRWQSTRTGRGTRVQSSIPTGARAVRAQGLQVRGVVVAVYVYDSESFLNQEVQPNDIYVDVLVYGRHNTVIPRVLWTVERSGLHEGDICIPRAARLDVTGEDLNLKVAKPQTLDGDHVIVGFLEDDLAQPYVVRSIQHPSSDIGNSARPLGQRMRLLEGDGNPRLWKHRGSAFGLDPDGNFIMDTRRAHSGEYEANGAEPTPTEDGSNGNTVIDLQEGSTLIIRIGDGENLELTQKDGEATLKLGDGAVSFAIAENLQNYIDNQVKTVFDAHTHPYAFGPTGPPSTPLPGYDSSITSTKATLPDG